MNWSANQWKRVSLSEEFKIEIFGSDTTIYKTRWRLRHAFGCIADSGVGDLILIDQLELI